MALIAAQMYTLREVCKTPAQIAVACAKVKKMGYDGIQLSGCGPIEAQELKNILDGEGLQMAATHVGLDQLRDDTAKVIDEHQLWNCRYTAIGGFFPKEAWTLALWEKFIADFNAIAAKLSGSGLTLGYHNHHHEFSPPMARENGLLINRLTPSSGSSWTPTVAARLLSPMSSGSPDASPACISKT